MKENLRDYATVGLAHFMFWPDCVRDTRILIDTLPAFVKRSDIDMLDCCFPYGEQQRAKLIPLVRDCGKVVHVAVHLFPMDKISLGSTADNEKGLIRLAMRDQIEVAAAAGAQGVTFTSGLGCAAAERPAAKQAFADFCRWFCGELAKHQITGLLEHFDTDFDRRFLYGSTLDTVELIESLKPGIDNLRIQLDVAHVRLLGESFEHAIRTAAPYLGHVHLGNCVMKDRADPFFGDRHPPIGYEGGEIGVADIVEALKILLDVGYLGRERRGPLAVEARPPSGASADETIRQQLELLEEAWRRV